MYIYKMLSWELFLNHDVRKNHGLKLLNVNLRPFFFFSYFYNSVC